jgi:hypothetical protein
MTCPGRGALVCLCLLSLPLLSFAQTENDTAGNAAAASLERTLSRVVKADFSPLSLVEAAFPSDDVLLAQAQGNPPNQTQPTDTNPAAPSLGDLGFPTAQTQGNAQDQARLDRRSHMLKLHQRMGLITLAPLIATIATSGMAAGRHPTAEGRDIHGGLGAVTADMYFMTAYYALRAPRVPGTTVRGPIRLHKALAWVHGTGMILTPILGAMAFSQEHQGEKVHGIASLHSAVADVTYTAFGLAVLSVSIKF